MYWQPKFLEIYNVATYDRQSPSAFIQLVHFLSIMYVSIYLDSSDYFEPLWKFVYTTRSFISISDTDNDTSVTAQINPPHPVNPGYKCLAPIRVNFQY